MKKVFSVKKVMIIIGLVFTGLFFVAGAGKAPVKGTVLKGADDKEVAPLVLQAC